MRVVKALGVLFTSAAMASASVPMVYAQGESDGGGSVGATRFVAPCWMPRGEQARAA